MHLFQDSCSRTESNLVITPNYREFNITIDEVGKSKHNKTLLRCKESKDRQHVSALFFYKAIIRSAMSDLMMALEKKEAETCCLSFDSLHLNKVLLCFDLPTLSTAIL